MVLEHLLTPDGIRLTISVPIWMSAATVERAYRYVQRRCLGGGNNRAPRGPALALARFLAQHPAGTWRARMRRWNAANPRTAYSDVRLFFRDCQRARKAVAAPPLKWT